MRGSPASSTGMGNGGPFTRFANSLQYQELRSRWVPGAVTFVVKHIPVEIVRFHILYGLTTLGRLG